MTYPAHIRKKILAELEDSTYREVAAPTPSRPGRNSRNPKAAAVLRPAFSQKKSSGKTSPNTLMIINGKELHAWAAHKTESANCKADEEKRHEFLEVKSVYEESLHPFIYIDESGFRKDISRPYGYAPHGQKCAGVSGWSKAQTNVIGALCGTVPLAFTAFDCA